MALLKAQVAVAYTGLKEWSAPVRLAGSFTWSGNGLGLRRVLLNQTDQTLDLDFCAGLSGQQTGPVLALHAPEENASANSLVLLTRSGDQTPTLALPVGHAVLWRPGNVTWLARATVGNGPPRVLLLWGFGQTSAS